MTNGLLALPATTAQFETQKHAFSSILIPNYALSGTARDFTIIPLQFISISHRGFLFSSNYLYLPIRLSGRNYSHRTPSIRR